MDPERMMAEMSNMAHSMMGGFGLGDPFGFPFSPFGQAPIQGPNPMALMPQAFMPPMMFSPPNMFMNNSMMMGGPSMFQMASNGATSYCSSSVTSYTTDAEGRPQVYLQSQEVKQGPGGVKETKSAIRDSRTGQHEMSIGHHLNDKAHIKKKSKNVYSGEEEQAEEFLNLEDNEVESFEKEWTQKARSSTDVFRNQTRVEGGSRQNRLAITSACHPSNVQTPDDRHGSNMKTKKDKKKRRERERSKDYRS